MQNWSRLHVISSPLSRYCHKVSYLQVLWNLQNIQRLLREKGNSNNSDTGVSFDHTKDLKKGEIVISTTRHKSLVIQFHVTVSYRSKSQTPWLLSPPHLPAMLPSPLFCTHTNILLKITPAISFQPDELLDSVPHSSGDASIKGYAKNKYLSTSGMQENNLDQLNKYGRWSLIFVCVWRSTLKQ